MSSQSIDLINPKQNIGIQNWSIVNDDVMGGISKSNLSIDDESNLNFKGYLSLENNGGFASTRHRFSEQTLVGVKSFRIKLKGDGNIYKLRIRQNNRRVSYSADFKSVKDKWTEFEIFIKDFKPTWRGFTYSDYPDLDIEKISELGIQISDKQEGEFKLEIEYIKAMY
tara:strand:- start:27 stop:530 length:504 start_codon:yes stop_codon:yes gene_type:complete